MDEYIKKLRKHIGNSPLLLVAAGAIIYKIEEYYYREE
ncbi:hypothetical protein BCD96_003191 [Clostridium beijerinckii]|nr:hypothetical protein [Clostridium beijerinckii]NRU38423.1 hypothetical protein [Clostridium beijerinckii]NSA98298.1 hypothetical protein [Clostridium beijerinckii]